MDLGFTFLLNSFLTFLNVLVIVVVALALVFFLWGMTVFILNAGSEDKRAEGKQKMLWGIIALTVMFGIWGIVSILLLAFGIGPSGSSIEIPSLFPGNLP